MKAACKPSQFDLMPHEERLICIHFKLNYLSLKSYFFWCSNLAKQCDFKACHAVNLTPMMWVDNTNFSGNSAYYPAYHSSFIPLWNNYMQIVRLPCQMGLY